MHKQFYFVEEQFISNLLRNSEHRYYLSCAWRSTPYTGTSFMSHFTWFSQLFFLTERRLDIQSTFFHVTAKVMRQRRSKNRVLADFTIGIVDRRSSIRGETARRSLIVHRSPMKMPSGFLERECDGIAENKKRQRQATTAITAAAKFVKEKRRGDREWGWRREENGRRKKWEEGRET